MQKIGLQVGVDTGESLSKYIMPSQQGNDSSGQSSELKKKQRKRNYDESQSGARANTAVKVKQQKPKATSTTDIRPADTANTLPTQAETGGRRQQVSQRRSKKASLKE